MGQQKYNIGIVGAGIAGLSSALALLKAGHRVTVFEKAVELGEVGAGLQLSGNATRVLSSLGVLDEVRRVGFLPQGLKMLHWQTGATIARFSQNSSADDDDPYIHIHRADLHAILLAAVTAIAPDAIVIDAEVKSVKNNEKTASILFNNQDQKNFDWVVGADGIHSIVRPTAISITDASRFTGNVAWRGLIPVSSLKESPEPLTHIVMGPGGHVVFYYVSGGDAVNYVAVVERSDWEKESWAEKGTVAEMLGDFSGWNVGILKLLEKSNPAQSFRWALHDRDPLSSWSDGRCIILGDAAHPMLPFLAQGAAMGIEDAQALAYCLDNTPANGVGEEFFKIRGKRTARVQLAARKNMSIFHERNVFVRFVRDRVLSLMGVIYPEFMNKKLRWLYDYKFRK
ncbi:hypothetical protein A9Q81_10145 [Gammaproteobacteria bacterium 42_54_T18]|nr:hypothetical protein A9Q81_10145 [Gammaproteobacteria bacterium 42_54_T18]